MFRVVMCVAACALPLVISSSAGAQSLSVNGETALAAPIPPGPPQSITQRYVPHTAPPARALGLLIDDAAPVPATASVAAITVTSPEPLARSASVDLGIGRPVIVVSNAKGAGRE